MKANENLELGQIPVFHSGKRLFLMEWTADGEKHANHYLQRTPPYALAQYKLWFNKIAALEEGFDPATIGR